MCIIICFLLESFWLTINVYVIMSYLVIVTALIVQIVW